MPFTFKSAQKAVSAFALIGLFLLAATVFLIGKGSDIFTFKDKYWTILEEGYGLETGMKIKYKNAVIVGRISQIALTNIDNKDKIKVHLQIFSEYRNLIKEDSVLKVSAGLLGGASLALLPSIDPYSLQLNPGSRILSSDMEKGQELMVKLSEISPKKDDTVQKVNEILDYVAELKPMINATLLNVRDSTASVKMILGGLEGTKRSLVSDKLMATLENVRIMSRNFNELSAELNSTNNTIGALAKDNKSLYKKVDTMLVSADKSLANLKTVTEKLKDSPDDLKTVLALVRENLVESKKVLTGLKNMLGGEKETDKSIKTGDRN